MGDHFDIAHRIAADAMADGKKLIDTDTKAQKREVAQYEQIARSVKKRQSPSAGPFQAMSVVAAQPKPAAMTAANKRREKA